MPAQFFIVPEHPGIIYQQSVVDSIFCIINVFRILRVDHVNSVTVDDQRFILEVLDHGAGKSAVNRVGAQQVGPLHDLFAAVASCNNSAQAQLLSFSCQCDDLTRGQTTYAAKAVQYYVFWSDMRMVIDKVL